MVAAEKIGNVEEVQKPKEGKNEGHTPFAFRHARVDKNSHADEFCDCQSIRSANSSTHGYRFKIPLQEASILHRHLKWLYDGGSPMRVLAKQPREYPWFFDIDVRGGLKLEEFGD